MNKQSFLIQDSEKWEIFQQVYIKGHLQNVLKLIQLYPNICSNDYLIMQLLEDYISAEMNYQIRMDVLKNKYLPNIKQNVYIELPSGTIQKVYYSIEER